MKKTILFYKKALIYFKPYRKVLFVSFILSLLPSVITSLIQLFTGKIVDALYIQNADLVWHFSFILLGILLFRQIINRASILYDMKHIEFSMFHYLSRITMEKSFNLSLGQLKQEHSGFKQDVLKTGANQISNLVYLIMYDITPLAATVITALIGLFIININFFYLSIFFTSIYLTIAYYLNKQTHDPLKLIIKKRTEASKVYVDILQNLFLLKFSNKMKDASEHLHRSQSEHIDIGVKTWVDYNYKQIYVDILTYGYYVVCVWLSVHLVMTGGMTVGMFIPVMAWVLALQSSISQFRHIQRRMMIGRSDVEKMFDMLEQKSDLEESEDPRPISIFENKISFEHVNFDYKDGKKDALKNINFDIKKGDKVALVGRSGSGKTTIISLLLRLYDPVSGTIMIDGVDLKALELSDWHNLLAYVPQEGDLLDISIRENILFGARHTVTEAEIESVLEKAGIKEFIHNLPNGIDTLVGERGVKLSGGQKQRVCIARALIKNAPILLLDEATSSLDSETESVVNKAIWEMLGDKTGVVIAHRLSTILDADKIIVMDHGEIVGVGTHKQLLKSTPYYKKLVDAQNVNL